MITGIHHVAISVPDIDRAMVFYHETLGFEKVFGNSWQGDRTDADQVIGLEQTHAKVQMLKAGNAFIELWEYQIPQPKLQNPSYSPADHGIAHIALQVTDIQEEYNRLQEAGMTFHRPPVELGDSSAIYGRDPFGNIIELYEISGDRAIS